MYMFAVILLLFISLLGRRFIILIYHRHVVWKDWISPPLDNIITGHKNSLKEAQATNTFNELTMRWVLTFGETILIWRSSMPVVFTTEPAVLEDCWNDIITFSKIKILPNRHLYDRPITGINSFLTSQGGMIWALKRKMLSGVFKKANQKNLFPTIQQLVNKSIADLKQLYGDRQIYDMEIGFATMAENLLLVCGLDNLSDMFTTKPGYLAENVLNLLEVLPLVKHKNNSYQYKMTAEVQTGMKFITNVRYELSTAYREIIQTTSAQGEGYNKDSKLGILALLLQINQSGEPDEDCENFVSDIMTLILVADNISKVVSILFAKVLREQGIYEKMKKEAMETEISSYSDLVQLKYIEMVILELMRWCPVLQRGARKRESTMKGTTLGQYKVPNGVEFDLQWSQYTMHHNPKYWTNPDKFDPERFTNGTSGFARNTYIPFIAGPRACLGKHLAMAKMKILIHSMLKNFEMSIVPGEEELVLDRRFTIVKVRQGKNVLLQAHCDAKVHQSS